MTMVRSLLLFFGLSMAFVLTDLITMVRVEACPDEQLPSLIGWPFVHRTSVPWVNSMSGVLYLKGLLLNVLVLAVAFACIGRVLRRILPAGWLHSPSLVVLEWSVVVGCLFVCILIFTSLEWHIQWSPDFDFRCPQRTLQLVPHLH